MKKEIDFFELYKKIPENKRETINLLSAITGIIAFVITIMQFIVWVAKKVYTNMSENEIPWVLFFSCFFILIIVVIILIKKLRQYKYSLWKRKSIVSNCYEKTISSFLNVYFEILKMHKSKTLTIDILTSTIKKFLEKLLDNICNILNTYTGQDICACIKLVGTDDKNYSYGGEKIDPEKAFVYTFVRSSDTVVDRNRYELNKPVSLKGNTDFYSIIIPDDKRNLRNYFYVEDLEAYDNNLKKNNMKYENTTENYLDYYKGVIVTPITIEHKKLHFTSAEADGEQDLLGFLCVDTLSTNAFIEENRDAFVKLVNSFSEIAYLVLNKYKCYYFKILKEKEEKLKKENEDEKQKQYSSN